MSEVNHRKHSGTFTEVGVDGRPKDGATLSCCHCQHTWIMQRGSGKLRGFCQNCMGYVCGPGCMECIPAEQRIENIEKGLPETTPRAPKILVPGGEIWGG